MYCDINIMFKGIRIRNNKERDRNYFKVRFKFEKYIIKWVFGMF